jgi:hypothetical protein
MYSKQNPEQVLQTITAFSERSEEAAFALDVLNVLSAVCAVLIGRGQIDLAALREACESQAIIAHENGRPINALAAEHFIGLLEQAAKGRREIVAKVGH